MSSLVSVKKLSKQFGAFTAVNDISFNVEKGDVLGFLGPNGAGKSTTMRMATGYLLPSSGTVEICGYDIQTSTIKAQQCLGYLPEGGPLYNDMTPASFLRFITEVRGLKDSAAKERIDYVVDKLHLEKVYYQTIETLSKGYKRRVALAQAIIHDPQVLILDEPTDGLDPNQKLEVQTLISSMAEDKAIIISTHILEEVESICTKAMIIAHGKILTSGTPNDLAKQSPRHNNVVLRLPKAPSKTLIAGLKKVKNVKDVIENADNENTLIIIPKSAKPITPDISQYISSESVAIDEIYTVQGDLNESFRMITTQKKEAS